MKKSLALILRWLPAFFVMGAIFIFSSRAKGELPDFQNLDYLVKKSAHVLIYGALALTYLHALRKRNYPLAWFLTILYALGDEFHQSFVPGRRASLTDVFLFDNLGALSALLLYRIWRR